MGAWQVCIFDRRCLHTLHEQRNLKDGLREDECGALPTVARKAEAKQEFERRLEEALPHGPHQDHVQEEWLGERCRLAALLDGSGRVQQDDDARRYSLREQLEGKERGDWPRPPHLAWRLDGVCVCARELRGRGLPVSPSLHHQLPLQGTKVGFRKDLYTLRPE